RTPEALAAFERIFAMDDSFLDAYNNAGLCYLKMNRPALARRMWERALSIDPFYRPARENLSRLIRGDRRSP
ncbi:MAG: tetratricopeptide repeat protein, partial [Candidatus Aureabacteria bacterium]|nr:tetratricopeptide repeat protein [Candidatus Auribacterota bacterium]